MDTLYANIANKKEQKIILGKTQKQSSCLISFFLT